MSEEQKPLSEAELIVKRAEEKKAKFEAQPERFVCLDDLVVAVMRTDKGMAIQCFPHKRSEAIKAKGEVDAALTKIILEMDLEMDMERMGRIVQPKHGILSAARRGLFRK